MEYHYKEALQVPEKWAEKKRKSFDCYGGQSSEEEDYGKKERLHQKTMQAINCYSEIYNFDDQKYNQEFIHELSILTK